MCRSQQATRLAESDSGPVRDLASHVNRRLSLIVGDRVDQAPSECLVGGEGTSVECEVECASKPDDAGSR
jgi:hypothetical protein